MLNKTSKSLFSRHYLTRRLPDHPEWREDPGPALAALRQLYAAQKDRLPLYNEDQTEEEFILPILRDVLGFAGAYTVEATARQQGRVQRPDYALFANAAQKKEADRHLGDERAFYARAAAVADAKYWQRPLSQKRADERDAWRNSNPSFQIVNYLAATGVDWGVLTNGRIWRLYSRQVSGTATEFYEVDLFDVLEPDPDQPGDPINAFKRWQLFFRRAAFAPDSQGRSFLERVRAGSAAYARVVGDQLKDRVFDQIFPLLAGGFVADMAWHGRDCQSETARRQIQEATLSLLYKLLFLLYGEARGLLPLDHRGYRRQSLTAMTQEIAGLLDRQEPLGETAGNFYHRLLALFVLIDRGDRGLGLPRYNGGLFHFDFREPANQERHEANYFLTRHAVGDRRLAQALDLLARLDGEAVDYAYLGVRHLGAIYEGLLEYRLVVDDAAAGIIHLENDKGERKATGSYYTPDYVVKYIVAQTLEPILETRWLQFDEQMARLAELRRQLADPRQIAHVKLLRGQLEKLELAARETLLDIKVCDPAMGSGHFLVEAVDYLTTNLIAILNDYPDDNPILTWLARIRREIVSVMAAQGIPVDEERLDDTQLLQRVIMKRCIYGVDLNRMAVELAKVSLWLHTFTVGAPLSFLDHHLRWGNSLAGSMARDADREMAQMGDGPQAAFTFMRGPFAGLLQAAGIMQEISLLSDATLDEVEQSESLFAQFDRQARPYKRLLDVYVARHFGVKRADEFLRLYGADALTLAAAELSPPYREVLTQSRQLFNEMRFFHWDLEFPEVFIDLARADWRENGGFDAVVGNPPYVRQEQMAAIKPFLTKAYQPVYKGTADLYVYFLYAGVRLLRLDGFLSYIVSNKWLRAGYGEGLRRFLAETVRIKEIVDFGHAPIFAEADTFPCILVLQKPQEDEADTAVDQTLICPFPRTALGQVGLDSYVAAHSYWVSSSRFGATPWSLERPEVDDLMQKITQAGIPLSEFSLNKPYRGILTGFNKAFLIDTTIRDRLVQSDPESAQIIKPYLRGQDIKRWSPHWADLWIILLKSSENFTWPWSNADDEAEAIFARTYPSIHEYFKTYEKRLRKRQDQGRFWWELRSCTYYDAFEKPTIIHTDITWRPQFALSVEPVYLLNTAYMWPTDDLYLLGVVNSPLLWSYMWRNAMHGKDEALRLIYSFVENLPIAQPTDKIRAAVETAVARLITLTQEHRAISEELLDWLRAEFGVDKPGQKLATFADLTVDTFMQEVKKRGGGNGRLTPTDVRVLQEHHTSYTATARQLTGEMNRLEQKVAGLVNKAYGLTAEEIAWLWQTAPPRMPIAPPQEIG